MSFVDDIEYPVVPHASGRMKQYMEIHPIMHMIQSPNKDEQIKTFKNWPKKFGQ